MWHLCNAPKVGSTRLQALQGCLAGNNAATFSLTLNTSSRAESRTSRSEMLQHHLHANSTTSWIHQYFRMRTPRSQAMPPHTYALSLTRQHDL